jgi:hypothetical protein
MQMQHGPATWACSMDVKHRNLERSCSVNKQHGYAYTLLKTLVFPPVEWIWALDLGFQCGEANGKKRELALFSFALGAVAFFALVLNALSLSRGRKQAPSCVYF